MEPNFGNEFAGADAMQKITTPVHCYVHSIRKRVGDVDGVSAKAVIDGIIEAGILTDDSHQYIKSITFTQEKGEPEKTIIRFYETA